MLRVISRRDILRIRCNLARFFIEGHYGVCLSLDRDTGDYVTQWHTECCCNPCHVAECDIPFSTFHSADVPRIQIRPPTELFLRKSLRFSNPSHVVSEHNEIIHATRILPSDLRCVYSCAEAPDRGREGTVDIIQQFCYNSVSSRRNLPSEARNNHSCETIARNPTSSRSRVGMSCLAVRPDMATDTLPVFRPSTEPLLTT